MTNLTARRRHDRGASSQRRIASRRTVLQGVEFERSRLTAAERWERAGHRPVTDLADRAARTGLSARARAVRPRLHGSRACRRCGEPSAARTGEDVQRRGADHDLQRRVFGARRNGTRERRHRQDMFVTSIPNRCPRGTMKRPAGFPVCWSERGLSCPTSAASAATALSSSAIPPFRLLHRSTWFSRALSMKTA